MIIRNLIKRSVLELKKSGIQTAELDVKVLLSAALDKDSVYVITHFDELLTNREYLKFRKYMRLRKKHLPVAYILGHKEFYGHNFLINRNVLIPRPETEFLVESVLNTSRVSSANWQIGSRDLKILDIGTGSGCIILSLALEYQKSNFEPKLYACDNSSKALYVAKKNAKKLKINNVKFYHSDLFSNKRLSKKYDIIIANLPYVPATQKDKLDKSIDFEPASAIFAKKNGSAIIFNLLDHLRDKIKSKYIFLEIDPINANEIKKYTQKILPKAKVEIKKDLANKQRYLFVKI